MKFQNIICLVVSIRLAQAGPITLDQLNKEWTNFKQTYMKQYQSSYEEQFRKKVFLDNLEYINKHNEKYERGLTSFNLAINKFADMTEQEFRLKGSADIPKDLDQMSSVSSGSLSYNGDIPDEIDWTELNAVTEVKDQEQCDLGWAFSTVAAVEGQNAIKNKKLFSLSAQQLLDCDLYNPPCDFGWTYRAFYYIEIIGLTSESHYPYTGNASYCKYEDITDTVNITGFIKLKYGNETMLKVTIATIGPVSVTINASLRDFHLYKSGVYDNGECVSSPVNHAVTVVGYGQVDGKKFWKVKNSWGKYWGMDGYILMSRDKFNQCCIACLPLYPTM